MKVFKTKNVSLYGSLLEKGTSNDFTYLKYSDGTLIQYGNIPKTNFLTTTIYSSVSGGVTWYRSGANQVVFPISFKDSNYSINLTVHSTYTAGARVYMARLNGKNPSNFTQQLTSTDNSRENDPGYTPLESVSFIAIGRWK